MKTSANTTLALWPFGKRPVSISDIIDRGPAVSSMNNVDQNDASLERLDGVRILVNGWRLSGTKR
jgi:hypothetical protein